MRAGLNNPIQKAVQVAKSFIRRGKPSPSEELREWLKANPEIAEESKQGFKAIREGRYTKVSRRGGSI